MARIVDQRMTGSATLDAADKADARKKLAQLKSANPLRRVKLNCRTHVGWVRDPIAEKKDRIWCPTCNDWATVIDVEQ